MKYTPTRTSYNARYTFSAKEKDTETGYSYFGARYYSSGLSIWLSVDPMADKYPSMSAYTYCADNPVKLVDPNGEEIWIVFEETNADGTNTQRKVQYCDTELYNDDGSLYDGGNEYAVAVKNDLNELRKISPVYNERINTLENSDCIHTVKMPNGTGNNDKKSFNHVSLENTQDAFEGTPVNTTIYYDPNKAETINGEVRNPIIGLAHEIIGHSFDADQGSFDYNKTSNGIPMYEVNACNVENVARKHSGEAIRTHYGSKRLP